MSLAEKLIKHMETAQPVIDSLIEAATSQLEALNKNNLDLLNETIQQQNLVIKDFKKIEKEIVLGQQELAKDLGLLEYKLADVISKVDSNVAKQLVEVQEITRIKLEKLKQTNEVNNMVVRQNLAYTQKMVQVISKLNDQGNGQTYSQNGQVKQEQNNSLLNKQV